LRLCYATFSLTLISVRLVSILVSELAVINFPEGRAEMTSKRLTIKTLIPMAAFLAAIAPSALANDSSAEIGTGGLVFVKNPDVEMLSEDLYISTTEIGVRYRFLNKSNTDITTFVAFPLPDIALGDDDAPDLTIPTDDPVNLFGFTTTVEGQRVHANVEQKAYVLGRDQTEILTRLRIPLAPHLENTRRAVARLPAADKDELKRLGLVKDDDDSEKPLWTLRTSFYWQQLFPASRETIIEHRYKPSVGNSAGTSVGSREFQRSEYFREYQRKYCMEPSFLRSVERTTNGSLGSSAFQEYRIEYILKTGANWSGPIKDFRVVVDKGKTTNIVSFCGDQVQKIGPTQFEMRAKNFVPYTDFYVLILQRWNER
jgi:hypothetical protein